MKKSEGKAIGTWSSVTTVVTIGRPYPGRGPGGCGVVAIYLLYQCPAWADGVADPMAEGAEKAGMMRLSGGLDLGGALAIASGLALLTFGCLRIPAVGVAALVGIGALAGG
jgi:hypothetical protein